MATIYEVSKLAGVSLATVSRVMNNSTKVTAKTQQKVEAAMRQLGYRPNTIAQSLASKRSNAVGVLVPELHGPFFSVVLGAIEEELREHGKHVIITAGHSDAQQEKAGIEFLESRRCDALILYVFEVTDDYIRSLRRLSIPVVLISRSVSGMADDCITLDNQLGGYLATRSLLEAGHREVASITGPLWKNDSRDRFDGYKKALEEYGVQVDPRLVYEGDYEENSGRRGMQQLLGEGVPFTALFCANDEMAAGAIAVARSHSIAIPDDLSIVGYDNVNFTRYMNPQLSTVDYPIEQMGRMAARCVLRDTYGHENLDIHYRFEPQLIQRDSIAEPRRGKT